MSVYAEHAPNGIPLGWSVSNPRIDRIKKLDAMITILGILAIIGLAGTLTRWNTDIPRKIFILGTMGHIGMRFLRIVLGNKYAIAPIKTYPGLRCSGREFFTIWFR